MVGRPKGTKKSDSKKLQTYRLSALEKYEVDILLAKMREKQHIQILDINNVEFQTARLYTNYVCIDPVQNEIKSLYIVILENNNDKSRIINCPVIETTAKSYILSVNNHLLRVNKITLNHNGSNTHLITPIYNQAFKTLNEALGILYSKFLKSNIIHELINSNNIALINQFLNIIASNWGGEPMALEYVHNTLNLDLFEIEDQTAL